MAARFSASLKSCGLEALSREAAGFSLIGSDRSHDHRNSVLLVPLLRHGEWKADTHQLAKTGRLPAGRSGKAVGGLAVVAEGQHGRPCFNYSASKDEVRQPRERVAAELPENVRTKADLSITTCKPPCARLAPVAVAALKPNLEAIAQTSFSLEAEPVHGGINVTFSAGDIPKCELSHSCFFATT